MKPKTDNSRPGAVLFLSHDGALDPLGQSQILPYLVRLSARGFRIMLLTFEKPQALASHGAVEKLQLQCRAAGIHWTYLRYHRRPRLLATFWDLLCGFIRAYSIVRRERINIIHARSYVAAYLAMVLKRLTGVRVVFDMRELWVDGRIDGGTWKRGGFLHRLGKRCERWYLRRADAVVSLTEAGRRIIQDYAYWKQEPPIAVIPTCVDVERFSAHALRVPKPACLEGRRTIVYLGSLGTWYRFDAMVDCFVESLQLWPQAHFMILTPQKEQARQICSSRGLSDDQFSVYTLPHEAVPEYLQWADVALYFITPSYAKKSSCPTKLGESLAAGLPVLTNGGIGDTDALLSAHRVGVLTSDFTASAYRSAWQSMAKLLDEGEILRRRCHQVAAEMLGIDVGVGRYQQLYQAVLSA